MVIFQPKTTVAFAYSLFVHLRKYQYDMAQDGTLCHTLWFSFDCFSNYGLQVFSLNCIYKFPLALAQLSDKL
uniref:Uncharacterized protein n=1 Tax=Hippocampus comes TaxID=109280 RepID=A0A3Q2ZKJ0_HIPCM